MPTDLKAVVADESRLQQVLLNLIGNAVKFTEAGSVTVEASLIGEIVEVAVKDTGIGVPPDKQESIFNAFEQADASITREYGGTGLGLSITRQLVEAHGGETRVSSRPGEGSTFTFTLAISEQVANIAGQDHRTEALPVAKVRSIDPPQADSKAQSYGESETAFKILVVDDEAVNQQVISNQLSLSNFRAIQTQSGAEALRVLDQDTFDLVLLDVMMPNMSGYEVCTRIRERFAAHELPVIMLTAKSLVPDLVKGLTLGQRLPAEANHEE